MGLLDFLFGSGEPSST